MQCLSVQLTWTNLVSEGACALPAFTPCGDVKEDVGLHVAMVVHDVPAVGFSYDRCPAWHTHTHHVCSVSIARISSLLLLSQHCADMPTASATSALGRRAHSFCWVSIAHTCSPLLSPPGKLLIHGWNLALSPQDLAL